MASVNKVILLGNLGRDPETRYMPSGDPVCNITIATSSRYKNKAGEMQEETEWHRVAFFGRLAEIASQYLRKGNPVYVEGRIKTRKYTDSAGVDKYATEIVAAEMQLLGGRDGGGAPPTQGSEGGGYSRPPRAPAAAPRAPAPAPAPAPASDFGPMDDDIPF